MLRQPQPTRPTATGAPQGAPVAVSLATAAWQELTDGALAAPITVTETGATLTDSVWTTTMPAGRLITTTGTGSCDAWAGEGGGWAGQSASADTAWTEFTNFGGCGARLHLYCFQQD